MQLLEELRAEHDLIDQVVGSLRTFVAARLGGTADPADGPRFIRFFRVYAGHFHHAREEDTLFVALHERAELPNDRGPIAVMLGDHERMARVLDQLEAALAAPLDTADTRGALEASAVEYSRSLWLHIDAENSVLFPEGQERLRRHGIYELPGRPMTTDEQDARAIGETLVQQYRPMEDPGIIRGAGCVICPAFTQDCRGLEREWWTELEWEEFEDHLSDG